MHILVSFCNRWTPGRLLLGLLDADTFAFQILQLPSELPQGTGIMGLAASRLYVYAVLQAPPPAPSGLLVLDHADLRLLNYYVFQSAVDVHSIWLANEVLYAVSTGTDEVIVLQLRGAEVISEAVFWHPESESPHTDVHHLNAIYEWRGELLVSAFGKKAGQLWTSTSEGFIINITRGEQVASGIHHPHSLVAFDDMLVYCESQKMAVRVSGGLRSQSLPGYTRGLCLVGQKLFVGTSKGRQVSKSTGILNNPAAAGGLAGQCTRDSGVPLFELAPRDAPGGLAGQCTVSRLAVDSFEIEKTIDLSSYSNEIYDLLPIEGTSSWPVV
jgi:hypothetical protein